MYKEASKQKLRFQTSKGNLSTEQLWDLPVDDLDKLAITLDEEYNKSGKKSFLATRSVKDKTLKLQLDVAKDILFTKVEEQEEAKQKADDKAHNKRIMEKIAQKQDEKLGDMSIKELEKQLR